MAKRRRAKTLGLSKVKARVSQALSKFGKGEFAMWDDLEPSGPGGKNINIKISAFKKAR